MFWNHFPLLRVFVPFVGGILFSAYFSQAKQTLLILLPVLLLIAFLIIIVPAANRFRHRYLYGLIILPAFFISGLLLQLQGNARTRASLIEGLPQGEPVSFVLKITSEPQPKARTWKLEAQLQMLCDSPAMPVDAGILVYLKKEGLERNPKMGDVLLVRGRIQQVADPLNPGEFDYRRFLWRKGIVFQTYLEPDDLVLLEEESGFSLASVAQGARRYLMESLERNGLSGPEFAVASAILLGYDELLDPEQRKAFSGSGAMHVLCVSGLHVGIIYFVISVMLGKLPLVRRQKFLKAGLIILLIWGYALLTGGAPSVLRAATMFSFVSIGKSLSRRTNIYNSLIASAFLLIALNPNIIFAVGFQLSYLAVLGIVSLQPSICSIWRPKAWLADKTWQLIGVSIAAQLATFPLATLYFHQFPNYFLITNLVVIPISTLILYLGMISCVLIPVPGLNTAATWLLSWLVKAMNLSVSFIEGLPGAVARGVYLSPNTTLLLYLLIIVGFLWLVLRKKNMVFAVAGICLLLLGMGVNRKIETNRQQVLTIYAAGRNTAIDFASGRECVLLADSLLLGDSRMQAFRFDGNRIDLGCSAVGMMDELQDSARLDFVYKYGHLIDFDGFRLALINRQSARFRSSEKLKTDLMFLSGSPFVKMDELLELYSPEIVVIGANNSPKRVQSYSETLDSLGVSYWNIAVQGAYVRRF